MGLLYLCFRAAILRSSSWFLSKKFQPLPVTSLAIGLLLISASSLAPAQGKVASTTVLSVTANGSSTTSVASGTVVTLTATVTPASGTLTAGQVNFCDASAKYCTDVHLLATAQLTGAGTAMLKFRPGIGSHSYKAVFIGTNTNAGSSSSAATVKVTGIYPSTTTIQQAGSPGDYTLTATVTGVANSSSVPAPTGNVSFIDTTNSNAVLATATTGISTSSLGFFNSSNPPTVEEPNVVVAADFNGDGIPDLAVSNSNSGGTTLTILLGNGDGTFTPVATSPTVGLYPDSIAVGDFNGDGIIDLAISSVDNNTITILLGKGEGTFAAAPNLNTGTTPQSVAIGDFNGDGIQDLAVVNASSVLIFLGNSDGTFTLAPSSPTAGASAITVAVGDFNRDGIADLAVTNGTTTGLVTILLGNGDGTFHAGAGPLAAGSSAVGITVADLNGDGLLDLAVTNYEDSGVNIFLGNGDGTFQRAVSYAAPELNARSVVAADFNGDGIPDLAVGKFWHGGPSVLLGNGDGTFQASIWTTADIPLASGYIASADFNGDGVPDIVEPNQDVNGTAVVQLVQPSQTVTATVDNIAPSGPGPHQVEASYAGDSNYSGSVSDTASLISVLAPLVITPASGTYTTAQSVTISEADPGATIYYAEYGTVGTAGSVPYTGPIPLIYGGSETIYAYATETGYQQSAEAQVNYTLTFPQTAVPTVSPAPGYYAGTQTVTIADSDPTAQIYYTTNGTIPSLSSTLYTGPIAVSSSETIVARAISSGHAISQSVNAQYIIGSSSVPMIYSLAGTGAAGYTGDGGPASLAQLDFPNSVVKDAAGNIYFSDESNHMVRKIAAGTGTISVVAGNGYYGDSGDGGSATSAELFSPTILALDHIGNLYIFDAGSYTVRAVNLSSGVITTYAGSPTAAATGDGGPATSASIGYVDGLAVDAVNNLYIASSFIGTIRVVNAATGIISTLAGIGQSYNLTAGIGDGGPAGSAVFRSPAGLAFDSSGNLFIADSSFDIVRKITASGGVVSPSSIITTVAGTVPTVYDQSNVGYKGDGGPATSALLNAPTGVALDGAGNLFIADDDNGAIREVASATGIISTYAGNGALCNAFSGDGGPAASASLCFAASIAADAAGNLFFGDQTYHVREIVAAGPPPSQPAATPTFSVPAGNYMTPQSITISDTTAGASIYVTVDGTEPVAGGPLGYCLPVNITGTVTLKAVAIAPGSLVSAVATATYSIGAFAPLISTVAGNGNLGLSQTGGPALNLSMQWPRGLAIDKAGNLYIADTESQVIWKVTAATGQASPYAGTSGISGYTGDGGPAASAKLNYPQSLALDSSGNLYIADTGNNVIREVVAATGTINTVAGTGSLTSTILGDGGPATSATLFYPSAIALDSAGNLYIADTSHERIRMVAAATGIITTVAGNGINLPSGDGGPATSAGLQNPNAVAVDRSGNIYIGDSFESTIRKVTASSGIINTIAGVKNLAGNTGDGSSPASAEVFPFALAVDPAGDLFIANVSEVREISASAGTISSVAGIGYAGYGGDGGAATAARVDSVGQIAFDAAGNLYFVDGPARIRKVALAAQTAATPVFSPMAATYTAAQSVSITDATPGATIYYTTDGSTPTNTSTAYTTPIAVGSSETIKAIAFEVGYYPSAVASAAYTINIASVTTPTLSSLSPAHTSAAGAQFTLTVNGSGFTANSAVDWGASALATTFVNSTQLTAVVPASDIASSGTASITVQTPGASASNALQFEIDTAGANTPPAVLPSSNTVTAGGTVTYTVTLPSSATSVSASCLNLPAGATCNYSSSAGTLTITTASATPAGTYLITVVFTETLPGAALILLPFLLTPMTRSKRPRNRRIVQVALFGALAALTVVAGCGGGSGGGGGTTPPPSTHQVTASTTVTLIVK